MSAPIPETEFRVTIIELDAQMQLRGGYEDEHGKYITTMSEEQFRAEFAALEGHIRLRVVLVDGGERMAVETRTAPADVRNALLFDLTRSVANIMLHRILNRLKAASSSPVQSGNALPLC